MNHDDPRLTQHVLGEENSAEMTEALDNDPAPAARSRSLAGDRRSHGPCLGPACRRWKQALLRGPPSP